jgi:16S rRNA G966 N2-methylase RsmD
MIPRLTHDTRSWEHKKLNNIVEALGGDNENYPDDHFDIIWIDEPPYKEIIETSEHCQGLDD